MGELVTEFPEAQLSRSGLTGCLHDPVFRFAEQIEAALDEQVEGERQTGSAIGEDAVVDVAAGGEVAGQGRGLLPHLAAAARVLVVAVGEGLVGDEPEALDEEGCEQRRRDALGQIESKTAEAGKPVGHHDRERKTQCKWRGWGEMMRGRELRAVVCLAKTSP